MIKAISGWEIRRKLLTAFCLIGLLPVLLLAFFSYAVASGAIEQKVRQYSHDILYQATTTLQLRLQTIEDMSFNVALDNSTQHSLEAVARGNLSAYENTRIQTSIQSVMAAEVLFHDEITAIFVVSAKGDVHE
ncbi:MAG: cache domain-containing protein, partial [Propionibacteriaceae bacterium]|nr:cache domain-containing protein [Propionibacteriaceae bacterium]